MTFNPASVSRSEVTAHAQPGFLFPAVETPTRLH